MKTRIDSANKESLEKAIDAVQVGAKVRWADATDLLEAIVSIQNKLEMKGLPKKLWTGLRFRINPNHQSFPGAYKYTPMATLFTVERFASGWFLTYVGRDECSNIYIKMISTCTEEQNTALLNAAKRF